MRERAGGTADGFVWGETERTPGPARSRRDGRSTATANVEPDGGTARSVGAEQATGSERPARPPRAERGQVDWRTEVPGAVWTPPAVGPGAVYVGCRDGHLSAHDRDSGTVRWRFRADASLAAPAVADGTVYAATEGGTLYALDAATGDPVWRSEAAGGLDASPTVHGDRVYAAGTDGRLLAAHAETGSRVFETRNGRRAHAAVAASGGQLFLAGLDGGVYARDATDGREHWRFGTDAAVLGAPAVRDDAVYVGTVDDPGVSALDPVAGRERWHHRTGPVWASPAVGDGVVFVADGDGQVRALDERDGTPRWETGVGTRVWGAPAVGDELLYAATEDGSVRALGRADGARRWRVRLDAPVLAAPAVGEDGVYVADASGAVYRISK